MNQRHPYFIGNWKMNKDNATARESYRAFADLVVQYHRNAHFALAVPSPFLNDLKSAHVRTLAQNVHWESSGAYTGEISVPMLLSLNTHGSLVAHSERRQYFAETNVSAGKKISRLVKGGLQAVYCVGETLEQRLQGRWKQLIAQQLTEAFSVSSIVATDILGANKQSPRLVLAYEPVWAIGTGQSATAADANEVHAFIRSIMTQLFNVHVSQALQILYGGSVNLDNVNQYMSMPEVDGVLVGGASLNAGSFASLCQKGMASTLLK